MKTLKEAQVGKAFVRLVETNKGYAGVVEVGSQRQKFEDQSKDRLWETLQREAAKANPDFVGYSGAKTRFLSIYPDGFKSDAYFDHPKLGERKYKLDAKKLLEDRVPLDAARDGAGFGEAVLAVYRKTNLLEPRFEMPRVQSALQGSRADEFVRGAAAFTIGDRRDGLAAMAHALKVHDAAKWTAVTYLPFLWRPETHMFLKPAVTRKFAARVGHRFDNEYSSNLDPKVYDSLLDMVAETKAELEAFAPRDNIDIQSFIWVVGEYAEDEKNAALAIQRNS
ncbi:MAG TPA: hypothetical protein VFQ90_08815 [Stellaceae bacterium]|nr:hypothetical protein [Stellaceae bacterium]